MGKGSGKGVQDSRQHIDNPLGVGAVIGAIGDSIPLVMQPVTPVNVDLCQLLDLMDFAGTHLSDVCMIPQLHRMIGIP